jgi:hypothetical protein
MLTATIASTSRNVVVSIPDEVIGFFNWPNPSRRTLALRSIQPLTEMSIRNLPGRKGRPALKADNLTAICEPIVKKMSEPRSLTTLWASMACYRDGFTFFLPLHDLSWHTFLCLWKISEKTKRMAWWMVWTIDSMMLSGYDTGNTFISSLLFLKLELELRADYCCLNNVC